MTFLEETRKAIEGSGHSTGDVMFIGSADGRLRLPWDEFTKIANFYYDNGFGGQEIAKDLIVYFRDRSYMVRGEYDGSEWWEYNEPKVFDESDEAKPYKLLYTRQVGRSGWEDLEEINEKPHGYTL